jgi:hypothetical protein
MEEKIIKMNETIIEFLVEFTRVNGYYTIPILGATGLLTNLNECVLRQAFQREK